MHCCCEFNQRLFMKKQLRSFIIKIFKVEKPVANLNAATHTHMHAHTWLYIYI